MTDNLSIRREDRQKQTAEVFTPSLLVRKMLNKLPKEVWKKDKTFCDPACGNGNFLIAVLWRKLDRGHNPLDALKCIYGVDIMVDNIRECRCRLLKLISLYEPITQDHIKAVFKNIVRIPLNRYKGGALDYDFAFKNNINAKDVERWMKWIKNGILEEVHLPVEDEKIDSTIMKFFCFMRLAQNETFLNQKRKRKIKRKRRKK